MNPSLSKYAFKKLRKASKTEKKINKKNAVKKRSKCGVWKSLKIRGKNGQSRTRSGLKWRIITGIAHNVERNLLKKKNRCPFLMQRLNANIVLNRIHLF